MSETAESQWLRQLEDQGVEVVRARFMDRAQTGWGDGASINWIEATVDQGDKARKIHPQAKFVRDWIARKDAEKAREAKSRHDQVVGLARVAAWASVIGVIVSIVGLGIGLSR